MATKGQGLRQRQNYQEDLLLRNIKGAMHLSSHSSYIDPEQVIQYVEAHDNLTLYDKLLRSNPEDSEEVRIKRHTLATSIVLLSQSSLLSMVAKIFEDKGRGCQQLQVPPTKSINLNGNG